MQYLYQKLLESDNCYWNYHWNYRWWLGGMLFFETQFTCSEKTAGDWWNRIFMGHMFFLPPSQLYQSTRGNTKHWSGLILSSSTTRLLMHSLLLFDTSTRPTDRHPFNDLFSWTTSVCRHQKR